jgi:hypothetical protein
LWWEARRRVARSRRQRDRLAVALHGPSGPSPSPSTRGERDGKAIALSPGTSDATTRLPPQRAASAGVLVIRGTTWSWRALRDDDTDERASRR